METLDVSGKLIAVSPIAVSPPGAAFPSDDRDAPMRLPSAGKSRYLPASTLRHVLRHGVALVVQSALKKHGKPLSLDALLALDKGFFSQKKNVEKGRGKKKSSEASDDVSGTDSSTASGTKLKPWQILELERKVREQNPMLGLLGIWGMPSMLRVRNAIPMATAQGQVYGVASGIVRRAVEEDLVETLSGDDLTDYLQRLDSWSDADKESTGLKHIKERPWEEILGGVECDWGYQIHRYTPIQSGAVLAALRAFAGDPVIGAHIAVGRGEVAMELNATSVHQDILKGPKVQPAGKILVRRGIFEVDGLLAEHLAEFDRAAEDGFRGMDFSCIPTAADES
ncbi:hypothetical protein BAE30_16140 [Acidithiobacillus caldus]|jgi:hypothetical protein|uniref:Uncharacterized protein n=1 Tax=Acidithiobacillus caldus TaxID=33059 RepID=A0A1E7YRN1_9PROT|nr:hypothetical protein BAE30_16140 [Acidithiobacillus caldus]